LTEKPGDRIGRYRLLQELGHGGCGVVYMAEQEQPVRRKVALKVIKLGMDTREVVARFQAERQALALMDHPNIAKVLEAGATDTGRPYFVMELVRGIKITDYCDRNSLATHERLNLFVQVCQAIQHAHQKGIIHRDIKPSNILVTLHDGGPVPKVIDFGIAKATTDQRLTDNTFFTAFEQFIGTPNYMSPEQAEMSGLDIDTRSDIYSLGVLLYELLTGKTPFDSEKLLRAGLDEMRRILREQDPPRPSTRLSTLAAAEQTTIAKHRHSEPPKLLGLVRGDLDWIVMKTLEKDRTRRYETASGLAADIQHHLNNEPVVAGPPSGLYWFQKFVRRNKLAFAAATAVVLALIVGLGLSSWLFLREKEARQRAVAAEQVQRRMQQEAKINELKAVAENHTRNRNYAQSEALYHQALAIQRDLSGNDNSNVVNLLKLSAEVLEKQSKLLESIPVYGEALGIQRKLSGNNHPEVTALLYQLAEKFWAFGEFDRAEASCREALAIEAKLTPGDRAVPALLASLADALVQRKAGKDNPPYTIPMWGKVTDPRGDCDFHAGDSKLVVTIPGTVHDLSSEFPGWLSMRAPRVLQEVEGDFVVQVKVSGEFGPRSEPAIPGCGAWIGAGLLLWDGDKNFLRLECDTWKKSSDGAAHFYNPLFEHWKDKEPVIKIGASEPWIGVEGTYFRLSRKGHIVSASFSRDGAVWTLMRSDVLEFPSRINVGVVAINTSKKHFTVEFSEFKLTQTQ
jgi:regulation of enolase protein 1 (concanavalin A-like superfamily)